MKKAMVILGMVSLFIFIAMAGYAEMAKKSITSADLSSLQGKWKGQRVVTAAPSNFPVDMVIQNAKFPLKGKVTLYDVRREGAKGRTEVIDLKKSVLKDGNLIIKAAKFDVALGLYTDGSKMELKGDYVFEDLKGTVSLTKK